MSKLFSAIAKESERQQKTLKSYQNKEEAIENDNILMSNTDIKNDVTTSISNISDKHPDEAIDKKKLKTVITELSKIKVSANVIPIRLSEAERRDIEDFIYITLRQKNIEGKAVSVAKLMRYALRYLMKVHGKALVEVLAEALKKEERLSI